MDALPEPCTLAEAPPPDATARLFHFTCAHSHVNLRKRGTLIPVEHPLLGIRVVWLTDAAWPDRHAVGLTSTLTRCDRMEYRYIARDTSRCRPWLDSPQRATCAPRLVASLEHDRDPATWWVSAVPVEVRLG